MNIVNLYRSAVVAVALVPAFVGIASAGPAEQVRADEGHAWVFFGESDNNGQPDLSISLSEFVKTFGELENSDGTIRDESESIIPTPGPPGSSSSWQAGDRVSFFRDAMQGGFYYSRITVYQFQLSGAWYRLSNNFYQSSGLPPGCTVLPCPPTNPR